MFLRIKDIKIGSRLREEYGDMEGLANSIKEYGLLHPIVVDANYNLIAGCRRLLACERIGKGEIEVKMLGDISERELRVIELEENIRRKDLTEIEKSKNLVELAEIKERELQESRESEIDTADNGKCAESAHLNNPNKIGVRTIAKEIGVPPKTLHDAKQHVTAVTEFPALEELPKYKAIETAKELRQSPPEEHPQIIDLALQRKKKEAEEQAKEDNYNAYINECGVIWNRLHKALTSFITVETDTQTLKKWKDAIELGDKKESIQYYLDYVEEDISKLLAIQRFLKEVKQ